jgi:hypothetical protein
MDMSFEFQQSITDGLPEPVMVISLDFWVVLMNKAAHQFSADRTEFPGPVFCYQISHLRDNPCTRNHHPCSIKEVRKTGRHIQVLHRHFSATGKRRSVEISASPLWNPEGELIGIIELMRDVTDQIKAEKELIDYNKKLQSLSIQYLVLNYPKQKKSTYQLNLSTHLKELVLRFMRTNGAEVVRWIYHKLFS